jgi:hypothetical protein
MRTKVRVAVPPAPQWGGGRGSLVAPALCLSGAEKPTPGCAPSTLSKRTSEIRTDCSATSRRPTVKLTNDSNRQNGYRAHVRRAKKSIPRERSRYEQSLTGTVSSRSALSRSRYYNAATATPSANANALRQPHIFQNHKAGGPRKNTRTRRWYKDVGLGFRTPKNAIEGTYIDKKCPFTGMVSIRGRILTGTVMSTKMHRTSKHSNRAERKRTGVVALAVWEANFFRHLDHPP